MESGTITRFTCADNRAVQRRAKSGCNSQICFAYLLSVFAVTLIIGGLYLSYYYWNKLWLILAVVGTVVNLFGSCFYYSGSNKLYHRNEEHIYENRTRRRRYRTRGLSTDQLMPTAPPLSQSRSVSQLSLNMIPQYFCSNESEAISLANQSNGTSVSPLTTFSQIFSVNGQSYLILPLTGEPLTASNSFPLQNLVVKVSEDNKLQATNDNQTTDRSDLKKLNREEQSCQTEEPGGLEKVNICYRDVQLQTLSRTQLDQIDNEVINCGPQSSQSFQMIQSTSGHNSSSFLIEMSTNSCSSQESTDNSLDEPSNLDTETIVTLIDLNDDNESNPRTDSFYNVTQENSTQNLVDVSVNETPIRIEDRNNVESECFNSFTNENVNEEQIDESLSIPPPSYQEVIDYNDDSNEDQPIVVDYGTL